MSNFYIYADEYSQNVLANTRPKIITIGGDFGHGNFGDVLQHMNAATAIKQSGRFQTVSVMAANAISHVDFPSWVPSAYSTDAVVFVSEYPLILNQTDPRLKLVSEIRNVAGLHLYGGGFLNLMWGNYVLAVVEHFLNSAKNIAYWVSGQQITPPFEKRVQEHIEKFKPRLFGVRDELSLQSLQTKKTQIHYSFDDATEALTRFSQKAGIQRGEGIFLHVNSSDYTANQSPQNGLVTELNRLSIFNRESGHVTAFQAFRDTRQDVIDSTESIKQLDCLFPFHDTRLVDLVGRVFDPPGKSIPLQGAFGYSCSYHVALWLQLAGIPCWLRSSNPFYDQKARALQVTQGFEEFIQDPRLADHRINLERRQEWVEKLQTSLNEVADTNSSITFEDNGEGPAPWAFFYKGKPTQAEKFAELEKALVWQYEQEKSQLHSRLEALTAQLSSVGDEAHHQRQRAEAAESALVEQQGNVETLTKQLNSIMSSRTWRMSRKLKAFGRIFSGGFSG